MQTERLCKECKYYEVGNDVDGPSIPWCQNLKTKKMPNPIGFLDRNAKACPFFEDAKREDINPIPLRQRDKRQDVPGKRVNWLFVLTQMGFWLSILLSICNGQFEIAFKMLVLLSVLWIVNFAKEVSADLIRGRIKFSR